MSEKRERRTPVRPRSEREAPTNAYGLQVLDRVFDILDELAAGPATINELCQRVRLHRSTTFRLLANLAARGFVRKDDAAGTYSLGMKLFHLGAMALQEGYSIDRLRPLLHALANDTGYTCQLWLRSDHEAVCVDQAESPHDFRLVGRVGRRFPLNAGASGKTLLAFAPEQVLEEVLTAPLDRISERTETDPSRLRAEIAAIRTRGWVSTAGELPVVARAYGAPVYGPTGNVDIALVVLIGKGDRDSPVVTRNATVETAARMSAALGSPDKAFVRAI